MVQMYAPALDRPVAARASLMSPDLEAELLLACARSQLGIGPAADISSLAPRKINWERLLHLAWRHGGVPILYRALSTLPGQAIPPTVLDELRDEYAFFVQRNRALTESLTLSDLLREENLPTLNFKGLELAGLAYQDSTLRPFGDIDLLVQVRDVPGPRGVTYDAKLALVLGGLAFPAVSVPKNQLTPEFARHFGRFALFTWTCNTLEEVRAATKLGARVILTDEDPPDGRALVSWSSLEFDGGLAQ